MKHPTSTLNGKFGILIDEVTRSDLGNKEFQSWAHGLWMEHGGLLGVRGSDLAELPPQDLVAWSGVFGPGRGRDAGRARRQVGAGLSDHADRQCQRRRRKA